MLGFLSYVFFMAIVRFFFDGKKMDSNSVKTRVKTPVRFIANSKELPEYLNLTIYYSRILKVPVSLPSFSVEVIDICYRHPTESFITKEQSKDIVAAKHFLTDRINYTSHLN